MLYYYMNYSERRMLYDAYSYTHAIYDDESKQKHKK